MAASTNPLSALAGAGASLVGGIFNGIGAQGAAQQQQKLSKEQLEDQEGLNAIQVANQMQLGGIRDQAAYQIANAMGMSPQAFNPVSYSSGANSGTQGLGGVNLNQLAQETAAYTPGAGGTNTNVAQAYLGALGYNNQSDIRQGFNAGSTSYNYAGNNYTNGTGPLAAETAGRQAGYTGSAGTGALNGNSGLPQPAMANTPVQPTTNLNTPTSYTGNLGGAGYKATTGDGGGYPGYGAAGLSAANGGAPSQWSGFSYGGGTQTPAGPGTSGYSPGAAGQAASYANTMTPPPRTNYGSNIEWG